MTVFSPEQERAIEASGNVLVAAAAGSGKTRVLVERIVRAVTLDGLTLQQIVAVTFTRKSAQELRERIAERLAELQRFDLIGGIETATIGTIHSLCARIVQTFGILVGVDPGFTVLDEGVGKYLFTEAIKESIEACSTDDARLRIRARYESNLEKYIWQAREAAAKRIDRTVQFESDQGGAVGAADTAFLQDVYTESIGRFARAKRLRNALDFNDLEMHTVELLQRDYVREAVRSGIERTLVDEFQDTNELQCAILDGVGGDNLFAVGDEWQSIYRFRNADVEVFRGRASKIEPIRLVDNYRSGEGVLAVVNSAFGSLFDERYVPVVAKARAERTSIPESVHVAAPVELLATRIEAGDAAGTEARVIAERVAKLISDGVQPGDIALLFSYGTKITDFEIELSARNIRSVREDSKGFFNQQQVRDVLTLLRWVTNRFDDDAALGVLASPIVGMQWDELFAVRSAGRSIYDGLVALESQNALCNRALSIRRDVASTAENGSVVDVVHGAICANNYDAVIVSGVDGQRRYANMRKLLVETANAASSGIATIDALLDHFSALESVDSVGEAKVAGDNRSAVLLSTIHKAKGLEFPYVFVCRCGGKGSNKPALLFSDDAGTLAFSRVPANGVGKETSPLFDALLQADNQAASDEEKRQYYVGMTRAERYLCISGTYSLKNDGEPSFGGSMGWIVGALNADVKAQVGTTVSDILPLAITIYVEPEDQAQTTVRTAHPAMTLANNLIDPIDTTLAQELVASRRGQHQIQSSRHVGFADARRERGTELHYALAHFIRTGAVIDGPHSATVEAIVAQPLFVKLREHGARAEMPYVHVDDSGNVDAGRFDAVVSNGNDWWIVDYKSSLPHDDDAAWNLHAEQMLRYRDVALAAGASSIRITLLPLDRPGAVVERHFAVAVG